VRVRRPIPQMSKKRLRHRFCFYAFVSCTFFCFLVQNELDERHRVLAIFLFFILELFSGARGINWRSEVIDTGQVV